MRWYDAPGDEIARLLVATVQELQDSQMYRRSRALDQLTSFMGRKIVSLYQLHLQPTDAVWPVLRNALEARQAKIAGRQKPKPQYMSSGATYRQRRQARKLDKFVEAMMAARQENYIDAWELTADVDLDACVFGTGVIRPVVYRDEHRIGWVKMSPWNVFVDDIEAESGRPLNFFCCYLASKQSTEKLYERTLANASQPPGRYWPGLPTSHIDDLIVVYEGWRVNDGRHVICVEGETKPLVNEPWPLVFPGLIFYRTKRERSGFWGASYVDLCGTIQASICRQVDALEENAKLNASQVISYQSGSIDEDKLQHNESIMLVPFSGAIPPQIQTPSPFAQEHIQWLTMQRDAVYEITGVSRMAATGRKEPGASSGIAVRLINDVQTERFSLDERAYENLHIEMAQTTTELMAFYVEEYGAQFVANWPGRTFLKEIRWKDVWDKSATYHVRIYPVSANAFSPIGRIATIEEAIGAGLIDPQVGRRLLGWADLEAYNAREDAQWEYVEQILEVMLEAEEKTWDGSTYRSPEPYLQLESAIVQVVQAYLEACVEGAPEFSKRLVRTWLVQAQDLITRAQMAVAMAQPPPQAMAAPAPVMAPPGVAVAA